MKKVFLCVLSCIAISAIHSQDIEKKHYTVSGGLLGAVNSSQFRLKEKDAGNVDYNFKAGWSVGAWLNLPVANTFSIEPQVLYSAYGYRSNSTTPLLINNGNIRYLSVPLFLKFHVGDKVAITAGPQLDFTLSVEDRSISNAQEEDFEQTSFSAFGGLELFPHGRVTIFGRYIQGFSNMNNNASSGESPALTYKNQNIQAGLKFKLFGKKSQPKYQATSTPVILDTDGDGINDDVDKCPNVAGLAKYNGCPIPDSDNDGINDEEDKCPNEAGIAKYNGCPIPDSDKDGINDEEDKCPNEAGIAKYQGCPVPDRDKDGINDEEDKCPDVPGTAKNNGCPDVPQVSPEVTKALGAAGQSVYFNTNSSKLGSNSNASLNKVVKILEDNPDVKIKIEGHTDNAEKDTDMKLSEGRAAAAKAYLVNKGISEDRITTEAIGATMPIADNNTAAGRTKNRRVEIKVVY